MIRALARGYRIPLIDYARPSRGLLVSSGAGCMMAAMDACPTLRWCLDIDQLTSESRLDQFLIAADELVHPFAALGWFSITDPAPLRAALLALPRSRRLITYLQGAIGFPGTACATLRDFETLCNVT